MEKVVRSLEELERFAAERVFAWESAAQGHECATVVGLSGELGAGKTAFVQAAAGALGVAGAVQSPTFVIEKVYALEGRAFVRLVHIDAYRLESSGELAALGFDELANDSGNLILIEWPENVRGVLPEHIATLRFEVVDENTRKITFRNDKAQSPNAKEPPHI